MHAAESGPAWRPLNVVIAGGGTGGHLFPGIAVAEAFAQRNSHSRFLFVGAGRPLEVEVLARAGFPRRTIAIEGIKGKGRWAKIRAAMKIPGAVLHAGRILADVAADLVVGVGGYAAGPVALAAWLKGIPVVLCEQNTIPGMTNRILLPLAKRIYVSFENTRGKMPLSKKRFTGNPVRRQVWDAATAAPDAADKSCVLVVGGSQGARAINLAMIEVAGHLRQPRRIRIVHQTGVEGCELVAGAYAKAGIDAEVKAFFHDMASRYGRADLVVCRSGATTVAELTALGKPAVLIPYPFAADNHQEHNARVLVDRGAAQMILEQDLNGADLARRIERLAADPERLAAMASRSKSLGRPDAAKAVVDDCYRLLGTGSCT